MVGLLKKVTLQRWQNVSRVKQVEYGQQGEAHLIEVGGLITPKDKQEEEFWRGRLRENGFFAPVGPGAGPQSGPSAAGTGSPSGQAEPGLAKTDGGAIPGNSGTSRPSPAGQPTAGLSATPPPREKVIPGVDPQAIAEKQLGGLKSGQEAIDSALFPRKANTQIPEGAETVLETGRRPKKGTFGKLKDQPQGKPEETPEPETDGELEPEAESEPS